MRFNCPNCNALYRLIKAEAGPETTDREINCRACGAPLPGRDGNFVLKYFLLRNPARLIREHGQAPSGQSQLRAKSLQPADWPIGNEARRIAANIAKLLELPR
jgi:predicted Zn finger-like uncharacterized protein